MRTTKNKASDFKKILKHGPRNSDIATYVSAAEYLVARGYTVFRMGSEVKDSLKSFSPKIIDYALNGMRTEFLDLYLGAHCAFSISTASGWDEIPVIFKRPIMYVNTVPQVNVHLLTRSALVYPKRTIDLKSQEPMSLREDLNRAQSQSNANYLAENMIGVKDLSPDDLVAAVTEMVDRFEGRFIQTEQQRQMQEKLNNILITESILQTSPKYFSIRCGYASSFLSNNPKLLD